MARIVLRVDGGPEIGYGHLVRTSSIAERLLAEDHSVTVATTTPDAGKEVFQDGVSFVVLPRRDDPDPFCSVLEEEGASLVFADSYAVDTAYQQRVSEHASLVVQQDDARHAVRADALINGNVYAEELEYEFVGREPRLCLGTEFVLLRSAISDLVSRTPPWREPPERALVTFGGSDVGNVTTTAVRAFDGLDLSVDVIVGPGVLGGRERSIRSVADEVSAETRVLRDPPDLPERMFHADIAITTASSTTYELLALGTPIICVAVTDEQELLASALERGTVATVVPDRDRSDAYRSAIVDYVEAPSVRRERGRRGRDLVDGRGADRVVELISDLAS